MRRYWARFTGRRIGSVFEPYLVAMLVQAADAAGAEAAVRREYERITGLTLEERLP